MREIEIKLIAPDIENVMSKLKNLGCHISEPIRQKDINFNHIDDVSWFESTSGKWSYPRLRIQDGKPLTFTVKKPLKNEMDCLEHELTINSESELRGIMNLFDYKEGVTVEKTRRSCTYQDYNITIDEVVGLGSFVEIEKLLDQGDAIKIQKEMLEFAKEKLGLETDELTMKGYDVMMYYKEKGF